MFAWLIPGMMVNYRRRLLHIANLQERLSKGDDSRRAKYATELRRQASNVGSGWDRPAAFLAANLASAFVAFGFTILMLTDLEERGRDPHTIHFVSSIAMAISAFMVVALLLKRFRQGAERPLRELAQPDRLWLGGSGVLAIAAFMLFANAPL